MPQRHYAVRGAGTMNTFLRTWPIALVIIVVFIGSLANSRPAHAQTIGNSAGDSSITVIVMDNGDIGSTFNVVWNDSQECSADFNVYIYGTSEGAIHAGSADSSLAGVSTSFDTIIAASGTGSLTVSVFCGTDDGTGRLVASASDVAVETDSGRPVPGTYTNGLVFGGIQSNGFLPALGDTSAGWTDLLLADRRGNILTGDFSYEFDFDSIRKELSDGNGGEPKAFRSVLTSGDGGTHSSISTTIADSGTTGSTFTITWVDADDCTGNYNLYIDNIDSNGVGLPTGATQDSTSGRVDLGSVAATTDPLQKVATFSTVKAVSGGDHISLWIYCGDDDTGRKVESYELPVDGTTLRPTPGTYSSTPGITELQIDGTIVAAFDPYKTHEEYIYIWNVGDASEKTIKAVLNDGYSVTFHGSTKSLYSITKSEVEIGRYATWYINGTVDISDADDMEDDFQFEFDDNDPNGTDMFLMSVSRGDYDTGHHYVWFVQRRTKIAGSTEVNYAENGTAAVGTYTIATPDRDFSWKLRARTGDGEEDDIDDFTLPANYGGDGVLSFASSPDFETPTDGDPEDTTSAEYQNNVYHTKIQGYEVDQRIGYWTGNYYGFLDVQVTVTDVSE